MMLDHKTAMEYAKDIRIIGIPTVTNLAACYLDLHAKHSVLQEQFEKLKELAQIRIDTASNLGCSVGDIMKADQALRDFIKENEYGPI
jgi:hypothetical protein